MKAGQLQLQGAEAFGVEPVTVKTAMRHIREAGLLTTGARGVNAPDMTPQDAARTALSLVCYDQPGSKAADVVKAALELRCYQPDAIRGPFNLGELRGLHDNFTLDEAMTALVEIFAFDLDHPAVIAAHRPMRDGTTILPSIRLEIWGLDLATLRMGKDYEEPQAEYSFLGPFKKASEGYGNDDRFALQVHRGAYVTSPVIARLAAGFRGDA